MFYRKNEKPSIDDLKAIAEFENITEEEAADMLLQIEEFSTLLYNLYQEHLSKLDKRNHKKIFNNERN
ncbi:MAG: hypothetical protein U0T74_03840 [Chitinophagales bacterium]